jgi:hypothetical protein
MSWVVDLGCNNDDAGPCPATKTKPQDVQQAGAATEDIS